MTHLTWAVDRNSGTATVFCMQCRTTLSTVSLGEVSFELDKIEKTNQHHCTPIKPWKVK